MLWISPQEIIVLSSWVTMHPFIRNRYDLLTCCGLSNFISTLSESLMQSVEVRQKNSEGREKVSWRMLMCRRAGDLVTPAHFPHKALGRYYTTETNSSLFILSLILLQEIDRVCESPRPTFLQYPPCALHCDFGLTDLPLCTCWENDKRIQRLSHCLFKFEDHKYCKDFFFLGALRNQRLVLLTF